MIDLKTVKEFLRIDTDAEDVLLEQYIKASERYVKAACGEKVDLSDERAVLVQEMLISDWFENRTMCGKGSYSQNINSMIMQLSLETEG